jgi:Flp pilus assembly protein TadD
MEKNFEEAYRAYRKCTELDSTQGRAFLMMAYCALELGRKEDAKTHLELASGFAEHEGKAREILQRIDEIIQ